MFEFQIADGPPRIGPSPFVSTAPLTRDRESEARSSGRLEFTLGRRVVTLGIVILIILFIAPLLLAIGLAVKLQDGGPVLFAQWRIGRGGRRFRCFKFRSMASDAEARLQALLDARPEVREEWARDHKLKADPRITPIGRFLRKSSLDELPQLLNIIRGEMSLVGPRPIVDAEVSRYGRWFRHYCSVTPGITGLWQVGGRNDVSYRRRVAFDVLYAKTRSLTLDLSIVLRTIPAVLLRRGY